MDNLQNKISNLSTKQKFLILDIIFIIIILLCGYTIFTTTRSSSSKISSSDDFKALEIPEVRKNAFKSELQSLLKNTYNVETTNFTVREGTFNVETINSVNTAYFIIDLDELKLSYAVHIPWSDTSDVYSDEIYIECPKKSQMKYPETKCIGRYNEDTSFSLYLPYIAYDDKNNPIYKIENRNGTILITLNTCINSHLKTTYYNSAIEWLKTETKLDLDNIEIITDEAC